MGAIAGAIVGAIVGAMAGASVGPVVGVTRSSANATVTANRPVTVMALAATARVRSAMPVGRDSRVWMGSMSVLLVFG